MWKESGGRRGETDLSMSSPCHGVSGGETTCIPSSDRRALSFLVALQKFVVPFHSKLKEFSPKFLELYQDILACCVINCVAAFANSKQSRIRLSVLARYFLYKVQMP